MNVPIRMLPGRLILEGCDLSGKSTLFRKIHEVTDYAWNIHDRSWLSMVVYGKLYGRDTSPLEDGLRDELHCLNNNVVHLHPPLSLIEDRYKVRGDSLHTFTSVRKVHSCFEAQTWFHTLPNVRLFSGPDWDVKFLTDDVVRWVRSRVDTTTQVLASDLLQHVASLPDDQCDTKLTYSFEVDIDQVRWDGSLLGDPDEGLYYKSIRDTFLRKIKQEIDGGNYRSKPQDEFSRRFIFSGEECISSVHLLCRRGRMDFHVTCRSSDVYGTFHKDLNFLVGLATEAQKSSQIFSKFSQARFYVNMNAAHVGVRK